MSEFTLYPNNDNGDYAWELYKTMNYLNKDKSNDLSKDLLSDISYKQSNSNNSSFNKNQSDNFQNKYNYKNNLSYDQIKRETEYQFRKKDIEDDYNLKSQKCLQEFELLRKKLDLKYERDKNELETKFRIIQKTINDNRDYKHKKLDRRNSYLNNSKSNYVDFNKSDFQSYDE